MDSKTWLWKRRSSEKTIVANGEEDDSPRENVEEMAPSEKELALQESVEILNEKIASLLGECSAKDELVADYAKKTEEALTGKERAELEVERVKEELNEALRERVEENERTSKLNAALKESMHQLNSLRQDQDRRVREAVVSTSSELEKSHYKLEEMNKMLTNLTSENSHLSEALIEKEMLVEDLSKCRKQAEAEFETLMARLDTVEKENVFLRYEFRMLEKEVDIRNEEMKVSRYALDASNKQCMESLRKMKKLEAECQRLRILVRKRLPGPAALIKMSRDIEIQTRPTTLKPVPDNPGKKAHLLMEHVREVEEQNKILKEMLMHKDHGILSSPSSTSSSFWEVEKLKPEESKNVSERKVLGISDMSLMDDFVEMEKLAIVTVDVPTQARPSPSNWVQHVMDIIFDQHHVSGRSVNELVEDILMDLQKNSVDQRPISGLLTWRSPVTSPRLSTPGSRVKSENLRNKIMESNLGGSICKIIELVKGLHPDDQNESESLHPDAEEYVVHEFRWKRCEILSSIKQFLHTCDKLLEGEVDFEKFTEELASNLTLILSNRAKNDQLEQSQKIIASLQSELETLKESKRKAEDLIENQKSINEDLDTQLTVSNAKLNEAIQKQSSFEVELEDKNHRCQELEGTCLELQLLLESITNKETPNDSSDKEGKLLPTGWEISTASAKLEECQDTIIELGKQLKALASSKETDHKLNRRLSLLDRMQHDDTSEVEKPRFLQGDVPIGSPNVGALAIVPMKKQRGTANFLKKLLLKKKKGGIRKPFLSLQT